MPSIEMLEDPKAKTGMWLRAEMMAVVCFRANRSSHLGSAGSELVQMRGLKAVAKRLSRRRRDAVPLKVWQDHEIQFDCRKDRLLPTRGEFVIDSLNSVEDTKGNNGVRGCLTVTNLRLIWQSHAHSRVNLTIGFGCVVSMTTHGAHSRLRGQTQSLYVLTKFKTSRYEFIFTNLVRNSPRLFTTAQAVFRSYETSKLYRDLCLRCAIICDGQLDLLPKERIVGRFGGVWNLSSQQGHLGQFVVTNVRLVWFADLAESFNVSVPYLQIVDLAVKQSKFGHALVVETSEVSGSYTLGFRVGDSDDQLDEVLREIRAIYHLYYEKPEFGVEYTIEQPLAPIEQRTEEETDEMVVEESSDAFRRSENKIDPVLAYVANERKLEDRGIAFSSELGLAIEEMVEGVTISELWRCTYQK